MQNLSIYEKARSVPEEAKKNIAAGRLKGMTDINPMWRIKKLTELFGPCGVGWWYEITDKHLSADEATNQVAAFVDINLFYIDPETGIQSHAIPGTGGSTFVAQERNGPYMSDECYKMALTDAIGVAAKALGVGADVYWDKDRSKYSKLPETPDAEPPEEPLEEPPKGTPPVMFKCAECGEIIKPWEKDGKTVMSVREIAQNSQNEFGKALCLKCIRKAQAIAALQEHEG